jgi:NagD protein
MPKAYLIDMDGVLIRGNQVIPGALAFIDRLQTARVPCLVLTNNSFFTPRDHHARLQGMGFNISVEAIFTSVLATAYFLHQQRPGGSAYVVGEAGLTTALHDIGYIFTEHTPEYVVLGETVSYSFERLSTRYAWLPQALVLLPQILTSLVPQNRGRSWHVGPSRR